ncbi:hypothetical protein HKBW3S44_01045 [Candidatus Hakubella thermalkaliphila]|uniref:CRISPR-associated protein Cmr3 n=3 Tax=Candidatus Hakubella thermalkaliphila TaxID=2754717 RepID=A0A6V8PXS0_9ACTN|nr:type III-B CRISPR module-associated Cmr3 family protein [Candidatus Hakubella thermalkaliphila]GFP30506.1 hypothetical protein HKBW3S34_01426 [Candidatus Hakubella thermalkaliphila]GFP37365.1 hypothetical protein HKBW3S44_01045 [Candidatus Hakubella thermalkaliphila]GFP39375.1 hypothetical protein HKBW3S47_01074 [Candidatus Hakubella thermalkaliphila]
MRLFIRPLDTQFHRSGLPFDAGQDTEVTGLFPPWPRTVYGALRAKGFHKAAVSLDSLAQKSPHPVLGDKSSFGSMILKGPLLATLGRDGQLPMLVLLPFPRDLVRQKDKHTLWHLQPDEEKSLADCSDLSRVSLQRLTTKCPDIVEEVQDRLMTSDESLVRYLCHEQDGQDEGNLSKLIADLFLSEPRLGIKRDRRLRTVATGMIYQVQHHRLQDEKSLAGLLVELIDAREAIPDRGLLRLGGDGRPAAYHKLIDPNDPQDQKAWWKTPRLRVIDKISQTGRFKAYLITPGLFRGGAIPDICCLRSAKVQGTLKVDGQKQTFSLVGACLGKKMEVGGWDIQKRQPKAMRRAVPPGSVYFFHFNNWPGPEEGRRWAKALWDSLHFKSWCSEEPWTDEQGQVLPDSELGPGKEGFGLILIGGW